MYIFSLYFICAAAIIIIVIDDVIWTYQTGQGRESRLCNKLLTLWLFKSLFDGVMMMVV